MKTIKQLNKKWWYRLIKVIFVLLIIFAIVTVFVAAFSEEYPETNKELDRKNTTITCLNGNEKTFSLKKANSFSDINLTGSHFNTYKNSDGETVDDFPLEAAEKLCDLEGVHSGFTLKPVNCDKSNLLPGTSCPGSGNTDSVPYPEYSLEKSYKEVQEGSFSNFLLALGISLLGILLIEELIRRSFYYVVLGSFWPDKK